MELTMSMFDSSADYWKAQAEAWQAEAEKDLIEIERLREHAVILAATAEQVERERCAKLCEDAAQEYAAGAHSALATQEGRSIMLNAEGWALRMAEAIRRA